MNSEINLLPGQGIKDENNDILKELQEPPSSKKQKIRKYFKRKVDLSLDQPKHDKDDRIRISDVELSDSIDEDEKEEEVEEEMKAANNLFSVLPAPRHGKITKKKKGQHFFGKTLNKLKYEVD